MEVDISAAVHAQSSRIADRNGDNAVDRGDLVPLLNAWGSCAP